VRIEKRFAEWVGSDLPLKKILSFSRVLSRGTI
jgi:hypothetical protein